MINTHFNAPMEVIAKVIKPVMGSAAEAEVAALHFNAQAAIPLRVCLEELGHKQPATRIRTDNQTAKGFVRGTIKQKRSRTFDRQFWWLKDRIAQLQFNVVWEPGIHNLADWIVEPGIHNLADYFTKHPGSHHYRVRPICLLEEASPCTLQGCIKLMDKQKDKARLYWAYTIPLTKTTVREQQYAINEGIGVVFAHILNCCLN